MYQIHKWEKKANQLFKNLSSPHCNPVYLYSYLLSPCKNTWRGKNQPCLSQSLIFLLCNKQSVDLVPAEEPVQSQAFAYPAVMALVLCQAP